MRKIGVCPYFSLGFLSWLIFLAGLGWLGAGVLRIAHWSARLAIDPDFFSLPFIGKSITVALVYLGGAALLIYYSHRRLFGAGWTPFALAGALMLAVAMTAATVWARPVHPDCDEVGRRLQESGSAQDAREGWFGDIKIKEPPAGQFAPDEEQVVWWGKFNKPFEYWGEPELTAQWIDPRGNLAAATKIRAEKCRLARIPMKPRGLGPGIWRINVLCNGKTPIDVKYFRVAGPLPAREVKINGVSSEAREINV